MGEGCSTHRRDVKWIQILDGKPEGKRLAGRHRHRWEGNIRNCLGEIGWEVVDCITRAQDRDQWLAVVNTVMTLLVP